VSGQTYDTAAVSFHNPLGNVVGGGGLHNQLNSGHKDFSNMLNTTAHKSSILLGDQMCLGSIENATSGQGIP
jgi:hypothetical protein